MIDSGLDGLLTSLEAIGADSRLTLPGVDEPLTAPAYMERCLRLMREREIPFDMAWSSTINRIQAPQARGGAIADPDTGALVREERGLLEEERALWRAAYEGREPTREERASRGVRIYSRLDPPVGRALARLHSRAGARGRPAKQAA